MTIPENVTMGTEVTFGEFPTLTWKVDPLTNRISGMAGGLDAMKQAVEIALNVRRYCWQIYTPNSGHELEASGQNYDIARVNIQAQVKDALLQDDRITGVDGFQFFRTGNSMTVSFTVTTVFGNLSAEVTL